MTRTRLPIQIVLLFALPFIAFSQPDFTANDTVPIYDAPFRPAANMGLYPNWTDDDLADIAAGNPSLGYAGVGVKAFRPLLPEYFLENWGYGIRVPTFEHYTSLDIRHNTAIIGYPSAAHKDNTWYGGCGSSQLFANLYLPIWDDGADGTPVNDQNYYALYLYKMVNEYKDHVKFWEVWNEPDQDYSGHGWFPPGYVGNWWENVPQPCDYGLMAPIFHYIRTLRISYEVIKTVDTTAYVSIGGLGFPSFLDLVLRHTDNPNNGIVSPEFPLTGGAYFDAMAFHSYPHLDGSLRYWSNTQGWVFQRHSDAAAAGIARLKNEFEDVLYNYGYDGFQYPEKVWIITEGNIPKQSYGWLDYIGTPEMQRNFALKALVECQRNDIVQYDIYTMGDGLNATNHFDQMGLYENLSFTPPGSQVKSEMGIAYTTYTQLMYGKKYDPDQSAKMNLPDDIDGGAFIDNLGNYSYVIWAKTYQDGSEHSTDIYWFPDELELAPEVDIRYWDFSETGIKETIPSEYMKVISAPSFVTDAVLPPNPLKGGLLPAARDLAGGSSPLGVGGASSQPTTDNRQLTISTFPNPFTHYLNIQFNLKRATEATLELFDVGGRRVHVFYENRELEKGIWEVDFQTKNEIGEGLYFVRLTTDEGTVNRKVVCIK